MQTNEKKSIAGGLPRNPAISRELIFTFFTSSNQSSHALGSAWSGVLPNQFAGPNRRTKRRSASSVPALPSIARNALT